VKLTRSPKQESILETLWGLPSNKTEGASEMHTLKISLHPFTELSVSCAASAEVRRKTKQRTARRQAVLLKTRVEVRHMNRSPTDSSHFHSTQPQTGTFIRNAFSHDKIRVATTGKGIVGQDILSNFLVELEPAQ
jgi:hypothetical protein